MWVEKQQFLIFAEFFSGGLLNSNGYLAKDPEEL